MKTSLNFYSSIEHNTFEEYFLGPVGIKKNLLCYSIIEKTSSTMPIKTGEMNKNHIPKELSVRWLENS